MFRTESGQRILHIDWKPHVPHEKGEEINVGHIRQFPFPSVILRSSIHCIGLKSSWELEGSKLCSGLLSCVDRIYTSRIACEDGLDDFVELQILTMAEILDRDLIWTYVVRLEGSVNINYPSLEREYCSPSICEISNTNIKAQQQESQSKGKKHFYAATQVTEALKSS